MQQVLMQVNALAVGGQQYHPWVVGWHGVAPSHCYIVMLVYRRAQTVSCIVLMFTVRFDALSMI